MTSSPSCSDRPRASPLVAAVALGLACAGESREAPSPGSTPGRAAPPVARPVAPVRVALFPIENLTGSTAPMRELVGPVERALALQGLDVVSGEAVQLFLARHRIRYTGGLDRPSARAAREELGVDGVVITTFETYRPGPPPRVALTMRLVSSGEDPTIQWIDGFGRAGDDAPGLLGLGIVDDLKALEREALARLAGSLADFLWRKGERAPPCPRGRRYRPAIAYRSATFRPGRDQTVAVVPFLNRSKRRGGGDLVALAFVRQLAATPNLHPVEPGVVREALLGQRIIMEGGISLEAARLLVGVLDVDLVLAGEVLDYDDAGLPKVNFAATMLDRGSGQVVWQSISYNQGDDGVFFFDLGTVSTAERLACRMAANVVDRMIEGVPARGGERPVPGAGRFLEQAFGQRKAIRP